jgi:plastocyanin
MWVLRSALWVMAALVSFQAMPSDARKAEIRIDHFSFSPAVLTVKAGTQITWTNDDDIPHTVIGDGHTFKSKVLGTGEKFSFTAGKPGAYSYYCSIHPNMTGKVIVK